MRIDTSRIRTDGGTQPRGAVDQAVVTEYAEEWKSGTVFPPVIVFHDGKDYWLADGFHRVLAARVADVGKIEADVRQGTQREAILFACGANAAHGMRRTNEDKRRAVLRLLEDPEWGKWSDREIARRCAVHHNTVETVRGSLAKSPVSEKPEPTPRPSAPTPAPRPRTYTTRHGTTATMDTSRIGRTPVQERPPEPEVVVESDSGPMTSWTATDVVTEMIMDYMDAALISLPDDLSRHAVINCLIKRLREKSIEMNRGAA